MSFTTCVLAAEFEQLFLRGWKPETQNTQRSLVRISSGADSSFGDQKRHALEKSTADILSRVGPLLEYR
jgi:hypothetical protein